MTTLTGCLHNFRSFESLTIDSAIVATFDWFRSIQLLQPLHSSVPVSKWTIPAKFRRSAATTLPFLCFHWTNKKKREEKSFSSAIQQDGQWISLTFPLNYSCRCTHPLSQQFGSAAIWPALPIFRCDRWVYRRRPLVVISVQTFLVHIVSNWWKRNRLYKFSYIRSIVQWW